MSKIWSYVIVVGVVGAILAAVYFKGGEDKEDTIILKDLEETVEQQEVLNEIRNNRPNDIELINSLRSGTF